MERLTKRDIDGCLIHPWSFNGINGSYDIWDEDLLEKQIDRLAAYEGTGLDPDEIIGLKNTCEQLSGINGSLFKANQEMGKDLAEWKKAEEQGRLVVLPCKFGDSLYRIRRFKRGSNWKKEAVHILSTTLTMNNVANVLFGDVMGKTVFLTREEAEAALALKGGEG